MVKYEILSDLFPFDRALASKYQETERTIAQQPLGLSFVFL